MVCQRLREGGGYHQEDVKHASAGKEKKGRPKKRQPDNIRDTMKEYTMTEEMAQNRIVWHMKKKRRPIATWSRPIGGKMRRRRLLRPSDAVVCCTFLYKQSLPVAASQRPGESLKTTRVTVVGYG